MIITTIIFIIKTIIIIIIYPHTHCIEDSLVLLQFEFAFRIQRVRATRKNAQCVAMICAREKTQPCCLAVKVH